MRTEGIRGFGAVERGHFEGALPRREFVVGLSAAMAGLFFPPVALASPSPTPVTTRQNGLKVGFVLSSEQFPVTSLVPWGKAAEAAGFDCAWSSDHFMPWQPNEGHTSFAWATLAAVGGQTQRMVLGTGVTCPTYRYEPSIVAEAFSTLGQLYPGRIFLGVGTGEALNEKSATGSFGHYPERHDRLIEAIGIIRRLWTGQTVNHDGRYYHVKNARLYTVHKEPIPIYVAGNGPKSAWLAGRYGDGWITDYKRLTDPKIREAFRRGATEAGKNPDHMPIVLESWAVYGDESDARKGAEKWRFIVHSWDRYVFVPDIQEIQNRADREIPLHEVYKDWPISRDAGPHVEAIRKAQKAGATTIFVHCPQPDQQAFIDFYGRQVLPQLT